MTDPKQNLLLPIQGMTCGNCASQVETALINLPGISNVAVDLHTKMAHLVFDPVVVDVVEMQKAVMDAGYSIPTSAVTLQVLGMSCMSCLAHVEGALQSLPGVIEARVSLNQGNAQVEYLPGAVSTAQMEAAVLAAGYEAHPQALEAQSKDTDRFLIGDKGDSVKTRNLLGWLRKIIH